MWMLESCKDKGDEAGNAGTQSTSKCPILSRLAQTVASCTERAVDLSTGETRKYMGLESQSPGAVPSRKQGAPG